MTRFLMFNCEFLRFIHHHFPLECLVCPHCGETINVFKTGGGEEAAKRYSVRFLGRIPIVPQIVTDADNGFAAVDNNENLKDIFSKITESIISNQKKQ